MQGDVLGERGGRGASSSVDPPSPFPLPAGPGRPSPGGTVPRVSAETFLLLRALCRATSSLSSFPGLRWGSSESPSTCSRSCSSFFSPRSRVSHLPLRSPASWNSKRERTPPPHRVLRLSTRKNCSAGEGTETSLKCAGASS